MAAGGADGDRNGNWTSLLSRRVLQKDGLLGLELDEKGAVATGG